MTENICKHCGSRLRTDMITDFNHAFNYAKNLLRKFNNKVITATDAMSEGYVEGGFSKKKMQNIIMTEYRRNKTQKIDTMVCTGCNELKTPQEFYLRVDYRTNFQYHIQPCKCCHKRNYEDKKKAKGKFLKQKNGK